MVNIYTLFYAACIPVIRQARRHPRPQAGLHRLLARVHGRLSLFAACRKYSTASPSCSPGRLVQAVGACGIIPVANAEIGATFPQEKKGMALGIAAAVAGIANVIGCRRGQPGRGHRRKRSLVGAVLLRHSVCLALIVASLRVLPNFTTSKTRRHSTSPAQYCSSSRCCCSCSQFSTSMCGTSANRSHLQKCSSPALGFVASLTAFVLAGVAQKPRVPFGIPRQ